MSRWRALPLPKRLAALALAGALILFYAIAADTHGRRVNTSKARGDQSGYLWDAQNVYHNWHGRQPPAIIGERNRMPLYAGYLALFYRTGLTDPDYFEVGKRANIALSLVMLTLIGVLSVRRLPLHAALNLVGVIAFGYFIYKAGYTQSETLFYGLLFATFVGCWSLFGDGPGLPLPGSASGVSVGSAVSGRLRTHAQVAPAPGDDEPPSRHSGWREVGLAALTGALAALAHLTKAAMPPFVAIVAGLLLLRAVVSWWQRTRAAAWHAAAAVAFVSLYLAVLSPYLLTSKRVFGHYFYNVNSTFYVWYDDWAHASVGTYRHHDGIGWPDMPASDLPSAGRYWREHSVSQIAARFGAGFRDMAVKSYQMFGYLPYLLVFLAAILTVALTRPLAFRSLVAERPWLTLFLGAYGLTYLMATAFYYPTSGTGTGRFFLAHLAPFFFAGSALLATREVRGLSWTVGGRAITTTTFHVAVSVMLMADILLRVWPRLMSTYGGF